MFECIPDSIYGLYHDVRSTILYKHRTVDPEMSSPESVSRSVANVIGDMTLPLACFIRELWKDQR